MKYQLTCPKCHHEFAYDNGYIDKNIARLGHEVREIQLQLAEHKLLPKAEQRKRTAWWLSAKKALAEKTKDLADLKAIRKVSDQQVKHYEHLVFKEFVKERFGEAAYKELLEMTDKELQAYQASGLMRHEYSRRGGGSVSSINNL